MDSLDLLKELKFSYLFSIPKNSENSWFPKEKIVLYKIYCSGDKKRLFQKKPPKKIKQNYCLEVSNLFIWYYAEKLMWAKEKKKNF